MTVVTSRDPRPRRARAILAIACICAAAAIAGCGTSRPAHVSARELADAQTFPYYRVYWVGPAFNGHPLAATDGLKGYINTVGDSVYYGDCVQGKGIFGGGTCELPLQVTSVIYRLHSNAPLGPQHNTILRGVPATVYDQGHSIEIYTGRVAVDVFSDTFTHAIAATQRLFPVNAPGSPRGDLPAPIYCPGLSGPIGHSLTRVLADLPGQPCQHAAAETAYQRTLFG